jgi:hypothetical protein
MQPDVAESCPLAVSYLHRSQPFGTFWRIHLGNSGMHVGHTPTTSWLRALVLLRVDATVLCPSNSANLGHFEHCTAAVEAWAALQVVLWLL